MTVQPMTVQQQRSLLAIALLAAFADGGKSDIERAEIRRIAESLGAQAEGLDVQALLQDILLGRLDMPTAVAVLDAPAHRQLAYELAVCVCDADGAQSIKEQAFLAALKAELGTSLDSGFTAQADGLAALTDKPAAAQPLAPAVDRPALETSIRSQAILCAALELLPQSWAGMAIIPLQVRLVYAIGKAHGAVLDADMVKEFIAAAGVGLTSQYLEQFGRKLVGGLLGSVLGGLGRGVGRAGTGMAMSFATTYALGHLALRYYGGGRQMTTELLRQTYQDLLGSARQLAPQLLPQIEQRSHSLDASQVLSLVRQPLA